MIREATGEDEALVLAACAAQPVTGPLCEMHWHLWRQNQHMPHRFYLTESDAVLKRSGRRAVLCGAPANAGEAEELALFLEFNGVGQLLALDWRPDSWTLLEDDTVMARLSCPPNESAPAGEAKGTATCAPGQGGDIPSSKDTPAAAAGAVAPCGPSPSQFPLPGQTEVFDPEPSVEEVLAVLESRDGRMQPEGVREGFWVDFHIRRNHGVSRVYGMRQSGLLASTAGAYAVTENAAYIACVETLPGHEGRGLAGALVQKLCDDLPGRSLSLLCGAGLIPFYQRYGFATLPHRGWVSVNPAGRQPGDGSMEPTV